MSFLADRLDKALSRNRLQPVVAAPMPVNEEPVEIEEEIQEEAPTPVSTEKVYKTLKEGLKSAHKHSPDEFGTTIIVVETIGDKIQLPMQAGKYIVDDIQKRTDDRYEVHLVSGQK